MGKHLELFQGLPGFQMEPQAWLLESKVIRTLHASFFQTPSFRKITIHKATRALGLPWCVQHGGAERSLLEKWASVL